MLIAGLLYLGFFALAASKSRHAPALLGPWNRREVAAALPHAGWALLTVSLLAAIRDWDAGKALVQWFGLLPLAAGLVLLALAFRPVLARAMVPAALALVIAGL